MGAGADAVVAAVAVTVGDAAIVDAMWQARVTEASVTGDVANIEPLTVLREELTMHHAGSFLDEVSAAGKYH